MQAEEGMEMTLTKVVIRPLSGVSADLTRDGGAGSLPENDEEFLSLIHIYGVLRCGRLLFFARDYPGKTLS